jgi:hypothetical protein
MFLFMECGGRASPTSGDTALATKHPGQAPVRILLVEPKRRRHFILPPHSHKSPSRVHGGVDGVDGRGTIIAPSAFARTGSGFR